MNLIKREKIERVLLDETGEVTGTGGRERGLEDPGEESPGG